MKPLARGLSTGFRRGMPSIGRQTVLTYDKAAPPVDILLDPPADSMPELSLDTDSDDTSHILFRRLHVTGESHSNREIKDVCLQVRECLSLRDAWVWPERVPDVDEIGEATVEPKYQKPDVGQGVPARSGHTFRFERGVAVVTCPQQEEEAEAVDGADEAHPRGGGGGVREYRVRSVEEYQADLRTVMAAVVSGPCKSFCYNRLKILEARFKLHLLLNEMQEIAQQKAVPHRDFYNIRKIDNHVHHSACMNQKHLLRFMKHKLKRHSDEVVTVREGKELTLKEVFDLLGLTAYDLSVDALDVAAKNTFQRFDKFNTKYNPLGEAVLRQIFLKYSNHIEGRYLSQLTQQVFDDLEANRYQFAEYRLSIYGKNDREWNTLGKWVVDNNLFSSNVRWMIQIPRLYAVYRANGLLQSVGEWISNIFRPLFEVTIDPSVDPALHVFLQQVVGFDSVDDESIREKPFAQFSTIPDPNEWTSTDNPPYALWTYYVYANLHVLNALRRERGFSEFAFRPHSGEAGDVEHLASTFLTAHSINHGLVLFHSPTLQYLFYLAQIGISMSPLSNNLLFVEYERNPFPRFFARGLNVTLSTDDPLMIHVTKEPLVEEYSVAAQVWKLTSIDMSEIARNSVLQSGFEPRFKAYWIGKNYLSHGLASNDLRKTNVPHIRHCFRVELLDEEIDHIAGHCDDDC